MDWASRVFVVLIEQPSLFSLKDLSACYRVCKAWREELDSRCFNQCVSRLCVRLTHGGKEEPASMSLRLSTTQRKGVIGRLSKLDQIRRFLERHRDRSFSSYQDAARHAAGEPEGSYLREGAIGMAWAWAGVDGAADVKAAAGHHRCLGTGKDVFSQQVSCMSYHPDGGMIATGRGEKIALWNAISCCPTMVDTLEGHSRGVVCLCFSHEGGSDALLASGGGDRLVNIWSAPDGGKASLKHRLRGHSDEVRSVAFLQDSRKLISGSYDGLILVWDAQDGGAALRALAGHVRYVMTVAWSDTGLIASGGHDRSVKLWDTNASSPRASLTGHTDWVRSVAFTPGSALLVSGSMDRSVIVWSVGSECQLWVLRSHTNIVVSVAVSPDGTLVASGSWDKEAHLWRLPPSPCPEIDNSGGTTLPKILDSLRGHNRAVCSVCFDPTGGMLATGCVGGAIKVWDAGFQK